MTERSCQETADRLVDYADGELSEPESAEVAAHVDRCNRCRQRLEALQLSLEMARVVWEDNVAELASVGSATSTSKQASQLGRIRRRQVALIAAGFMLLISGALYRQLTRQSPPGVTQSPDLLTPDEIRRQVLRAGVAMQLVTAANMLAEQPGGADIACERYRYVMAAYPETDAAIECRSRLASHHDERNGP